MQGRRSWVDVSCGHAFPLENLPFGAIEREGRTQLCVAIGEHVLDLRVLAGAGLLDAAFPGAAQACSQPTLNALLARGRGVWSSLRARLTELLASGNSEVADAGVVRGALLTQSSVRLVLPVAVGDYVDFYSSLEHASNMGKLFRPGGEALTPNWRWLPIGYHGRASSIVVSGTPIRRPSGQRKSPQESVPTYGPSRMLDFELELAFVTGERPGGAALTPDAAEEHIFGVVLLNDWSARDIQAWEYQPLGPFLGKSFATSVAPWIVPLQALEPFRVTGPRQEPEPLPYLAMRGAGAFDIGLEVSLLSERMRLEGAAAHTLTSGNFAGLYWSMAQQLAHAASNGSRVRAGDLFASGTISGSVPGSYGSLAEMTALGKEPIALPDGARRAFLEDGDVLTLSGRCEREGAVPIGLGSVVGTIV